MKRSLLISRIIKNLGENKKILDIGCTDMPTISVKKRDFLHKIIVDSAGKKNSVLGIDINIEKINKMNAAGFNCRYDDITNSKLEDKYDLIIAGEIIEHIEKQNLFIKGLKNALSNNGKIYISTPNPNGAMSVVGYWLTANEGGGEGHVIWQSPKTIKLLCKNYGLKLSKTYHCDWDYPEAWMIIGKPFELFSRLKPTLLFEIEHI
tara:strand:- start:1240 stop:1857 length:618 start_codon:yes stop_codon:yes gene_type:complete